MAKTSTRHAGLRRALTNRRRHMQNDVQGRIRDGRNDGRPGGLPDALDASTANFQQAIDMTLLQIKATALTNIDDALGRIDAGQYGSCVECAGAITAERLRALPFAARCLECETRREREQGDSRRIAQRDATPFSHLTG